MNIFQRGLVRALSPKDTIRDGFRLFRHSAIGRGIHCRHSAFLDPNPFDGAVILGYVQLIEAGDNADLGTCASFGLPAHCLAFCSLEPLGQFKPIR